LEGIESNNDEPLKVIPPKSAQETAASNTDSDGKAPKEALYLAQDKSVEDLKNEARKKEHNRDQKFRDTFESLMLQAFQVMFYFFMLIAAIWIWHQITPVKFMVFDTVIYCQWLSKNQLDVLQNILTGGIIAGAVGKHIEKRTS
jgi:hypothetical protein